eukprot:Amastigsp_a840983_32.p3 type:complete len:115 gc:universal Amastigsp_a840983_32:1194-1538(+)
MRSPASGSTSPSKVASTQALETTTSATSVFMALNRFCLRRALACIANAPLCESSKLIAAAPKLLSPPSSKLTVSAARSPYAGSMEAAPPAAPLVCMLAAASSCSSASRTPFAPS